MIKQTNVLGGAAHRRGAHELRPRAPDVPAWEGGARRHPNGEEGVGLVEDERAGGGAPRQHASRECGGAERVRERTHSRTTYRRILRMHVPWATMRQQMEQEPLPAHLINHLGRAGPGGASQKATKEKASTLGKKAVEPTAPTPSILLAEDMCSRRSRNAEKIQDSNL